MAKNQGIIFPLEKERYFNKKFNKVIQQEKNYVYQENPNLTEKDANLFYKLHFTILEYTNRKY